MKYERRSSFIAAPSPIFAIRVSPRRKDSNSGYVPFRSSSHDTSSTSSALSNRLCLMKVLQRLETLSSKYIPLPIDNRQNNAIIAENLHHCVALLQNCPVPEAQDRQRGKSVKERRILRRPVRQSRTADREDEGEIIHSMSASRVNQLKKEVYERSSVSFGKGGF